MKLPIPEVKNNLFFELYCCSCNKLSREFDFYLAIFGSCVQVLFLIVWCNLCNMTVFWWLILFWITIIAGSKQTDCQIWHSINKNTTCGAGNPCQERQYVFYLFSNVFHKSSKKRPPKQDLFWLNQSNIQWFKIVKAIINVIDYISDACIWYMYSLLGLWNGLASR